MAGNFRRLQARSGKTPSELDRPSTPPPGASSAWRARRPTTWTRRNYSAPTPFHRFIFQTFNLIGAFPISEREFPVAAGKLSPEKADIVEAILDRVGILQYQHHRPNNYPVGSANRSIARPGCRSSAGPGRRTDGQPGFETGASILDLMKELNQEQGTTFLFSTHDHRVMDRADRTIHLVDGKLGDA